MNSYNEIKQIISKIPDTKPIIIAGHENADQDSICSCIALANYLRKIGKEKIEVLISEKDLYKISWYYNNEFINTNISKDNYVFIMLDLNRKKRLGEFKNLFDSADFTINIDHHEQNQEESNFIFSDTSVSSTCEILFNLFKYFDCDIDKDIASLLYAGILTDTLCFSQRLTPQTLYIASELLKYDIDYTYITKKTFLDRSMDEIKALSELTQNIQYDGFHYVIMNRNNPIYSNLEYSLLFKKMTPILKNIEGIEVLGMFLIDADVVYGEFKSNINVDVSILANEFGGGGHKKAAGFTSKLPLENILKKSKEYIEKKKKNI